jgi:CYTH domain-containing protein
MEIERKFLVHKEGWLKANKPAGEHITQGYLTVDPEKTIRVKVKNNAGFITIKGKTVNISREEYEFPIPADEAAEVIQKFAGDTIDKIRFTLNYKGKKWEVDEFLGDNEGLLLAEIELDTENESFEKPEWIDKEVSDDNRYYNSNLSKHPFKVWAANMEKKQL